MNSRIVRLLSLLVLVLAFSLLPPMHYGAVSKEVSGEEIQVAKVSQAPSRSSYLSPGGEVRISWDALSLPEERVMALTFDDGPVERDLEISALLKNNHIQATFFFIGNKVEQSSAIVRKVHAGNHEIGYHSYRHQKLSWISPLDLKEDFRLGRKALSELGVTPIWFRPPYGLYNARVIKTARNEGMETILWTIDPKDWTGISAETIAKRVIRMFHPGAVLLFHSNHSATLQALPAIIDAARSQDYRLVSLTEWRRTIESAHCRKYQRHCTPTLMARTESLTGGSSKDVTVPVAAAAVLPVLHQSSPIKRHSHPLHRKKGRHKVPIPFVAPAANRTGPMRPLPFL
ncbi:MAG: polysaccharide deacetylase family protein [Magnetococcales bacterium]|nr:polysaccharide deacetylase family protein [Magnetococcales bacterium]